MKNQGRYILKSSIRKEFDFSKTDQSIGVPMPPIQKPAADNAVFIDLPDYEGVETIRLHEALKNRRTRRAYSQKALSLKELSFLLWATQGIRGELNENRTYRSVPSAGCRHAFETYLAVFQVESLAKGVYRYLPVGHKLEKISEPEDLENLTIQAASRQKFAGQGAVTFFWSVLPYRMEWRYGDTAFKLIAIDAGHICQNLYLACEGIGAGTCAIIAYEQDLADAIIGADGEEEFVIYMAPVGKTVT